MGRTQGGKPIKRRSTKRKAVTPKAGPKKRRTKKEMEEARKAEAIAQHAKPVRSVKKASKVKRYSYAANTKTAAEEKRPHQSVRLQLKKPRKPEEIPSIVRWLDRHESRFENSYQAMKHFQEKVCQHKTETVLSTLAVGHGKTRHGYACRDCGRVRYA